MHLGDNSVVQAMEMRSIVVEAILESKINQIRILNVLNISKLHANLLSVNKLLSNSLKIHFNLNAYIVNIVMVKSLRLRHVNKTYTKLIL